MDVLSVCILINVVGLCAVNLTPRDNSLAVFDCCTKRRLFGDNGFLYFLGLFGNRGSYGSCWSCWWSRYAWNIGLIGGFRRDNRQSFVPVFCNFIIKGNLIRRYAFDAVCIAVVVCARPFACLCGVKAEPLKLVKGL